MLPVVLLAMFMAGFDIWVVNVAAPSLQRDLHVSDAALQLIVGGYAFMYASGMVTGGRLGDLLGYRRMFMIGVASFAVASLLCGLAQSPAELVVARLLQGLTGAAMVPQVLALITATFPVPRAEPGAGLVRRHHGAGLRVRPDPRRPAAAGGRAGPGLARDLPGERPGRRGRAGRRRAAWCRGPRGAAAGRAWTRPARSGSPASRGAGAGAADPRATTRAGPPGPGSAWRPALPVFALTLAWERRLTRRGGEPLLDLPLFRDRAFSAGTALNFALVFFFGSFMFVLTLLLQDGLGQPPLRAGLEAGPLALAFTTMSILGPRLAARLGPRSITLGAALDVLGTIALILTGAPLRRPPDRLGPRPRDRRHRPRPGHGPPVADRGRASVGAARAGPAPRPGSSPPPSSSAWPAGSRSSARCSTPG